MTGAAGGERSRLIRALALSRRFHLYLARCASPRAADGLVAALSDELRRLRGADVRVVRLEPYSGRPGDAPLTDGELADRILLPLLDPPEDLRGAIHLVDASRATYADTEAWARFFLLWNEKRNVLGPSRGEVVVMLPAALAPVFAAAAPDVWSIRSGEYVIDEDEGAHRGGLKILELVQRYSARALYAVRAVVASQVSGGAASQVSGGAASQVSGGAASQVSGGAGASAREALLLLRAVPPLALFGGDLVVRPWVEHLVSAVAARELNAPPLDVRDGLEGVLPPLVQQRKLRAAEWALAQRRFDDAEQLFSELIERADECAYAAADAFSGLAIALAARDRIAEAVASAHRALSLINLKQGADGAGARSSSDTLARALRANALVQWCLGHLEEAERYDRTHLAMTSSLSGWRYSHALRLVERGGLHAAGVEVHDLFRLRTLSAHRRKRRPEARPEPVPFIVAMDLNLLEGDLDAALHRLEWAATEEIAPWPEEHASLADRHDTALALVEIARGNEARASDLLARPRPAWTLSSRQLEPEGGARADAFHAVVSGVLAAIAGDAETASTWFERALAFLAEWGRLGLDVRSRMRARVTVDLLRTMVQPRRDQTLAGARSVADQAEALLGDTAEDHMSRVLAVAAHRELARRLVSAGGDARFAAQQAAAFARPLGNLGVPAWDELLHAAEHSR
ncbi:hypothetical protein BE11_08260 [Sorangium cellulosum]|nr:hypothetical protein BE11_08260 [Sorangium cellulosum]